VTIRRGLDWILDLLTTLQHDSELQAITALPLISTIHSSQHPLSLFQPDVPTTAVPWQRLLTVDILQLPTPRFSCHSRPCRTLCQLPNLLSLRCRAQLHCQPSTDSLPSLLNYPCRAQLHSALPNLNYSFITTRHGPNRPLLLLEYSLRRERVYRAAAQQWTSPLAPLFRHSGVMSQYYYYYYY
jgi:hypothetical protein